MPTNLNDNNDLGRGIAGGTRPGKATEPSPGYETTDVNIGGIITFLAGLAGFLVIFFVFCFVMGKVINAAFLKEDGPANKWTRDYTLAGQKTTDKGKLENLAANPEMQQRQLQHMTSAFPNPRLDIDDSNQATADLHAREDLLLDHYSSSANGGTTIRIPIDRAMELIAERGLPVVAPAATGTEPLFVGDAKPVVTQPLTSGFARTGYELDVMEAREQKLSYGKAEGAEHAQLTPVK